MMNKCKSLKFICRDDSFVRKKHIILSNIYRDKNHKKEKIELRNKSISYKGFSNKESFSLKDMLDCYRACTKKCKFEDFSKRKKNSPITGLDCDLLYDKFFASQRPCNYLLEKFDILTKMKELKIGLIVNCEFPGEHPACCPGGQKLDGSGFAYTPSIFEKEGIQVLLNGWEDFSIPKTYFCVLKSVKEIYKCIHHLNKKVLVHCHAGFGRTATIIACFKMFDEFVPLEVLIKEMSKIRRNALRLPRFSNYCKSFNEYVMRLRAQFFEEGKKTIEIFLLNQKNLDVGEYKFTYFEYQKSVPVFLIYIFDSIIYLQKRKKLEANFLYDNYKKSLDKKYLLDKEQNIDELKKEINKYHWECLYKCENIEILFYLLFCWLKHSIRYVINIGNVIRIKEGYKEYEKELKEFEVNTLIYICKFLSLIDEGNEEKKYLKVKNDFIKILACYLLHYPSEIITTDENRKMLVNKLIGLINYMSKEIK